MKEIKRWIAGALMCALLLSDTALPAAFAAQTEEEPVDGVFSADMDAESGDTTVDGVLSAVQTAEESTTDQIQNLTLRTAATQGVDKPAVYEINGCEYIPCLYHNDGTIYKSSCDTLYYNSDTLTVKYTADLNAIDVKGFGGFDSINLMSQNNYSDYYGYGSLYQDGTYTKDWCITAASGTNCVTYTVNTAQFTGGTDNKKRLCKLYAAHFFGRNKSDFKDSSGNYNVAYRYDTAINLVYDAAAPVINSLSVDEFGLITVDAYDVASDGFTASGIVEYGMQYNTTALPADDAWISAYSIEAERTTLRAWREGTFYIFVKDRAGNVSYKSIAVSNLPYGEFIFWAGDFGDNSVRAVPQLLSSKDGGAKGNEVHIFYNVDKLSFRIFSYSTKMNYLGLTPLKNQWLALATQIPGYQCVNALGSADCKVVQWATEGWDGYITTKIPLSSDPDLRLERFYWAFHYVNESDLVNRYDLVAFMYYDKNAPTVTVTKYTDTSITIKAADNATKNSRDNAIASGIGGYYISTNAQTPDADASGWVNLDGYQSGVSLGSTTKIAEYTFKNLAKNTKYYIFVKDAVGNINGVNVTTDGTSPTMSSLTADKGTSGYVNSAIKLTASATDDNSGIAGYYFSNISTPPAASASGWQSQNTKSVTTSGKSTWYCWAKDNAGNVSSNYKTITVYYDATKPTIDNVSATSEGGSSFQTVTVSGVSDTGDSGLASYGYATSNNSSAVSIWTNNTAASFTFTISSNGTYYVFVKDKAGNVSASKSVTITGIWPKVTNPTATSVKLGEKATFTVTASGGNPSSYTYQWQVCKDGNTWNDLTRTSADTATYTSAAATAAMNGYKYRCVVSNGQYTVTSGAATLTVYYKPTVTPPAATTVNVGEKATFSVSTTGGNPAGITSYQWYVTENGVTRALTASDGSGCQTATFQTNAATIEMSGNAYYCVLSTAQFTNIQSASAVLTVKDIAPGYVSQSDAGLTANGGTASFTATFTGTNLTYTWYYATSKAQADAGNGVALASCKEGGNASGSGYTLTGGTGAVNAQKTTTLTVTANLNNRGYYYYCKASNSNGSARSLSARLKVKHTMNVSVTINDGTALQYSQALSLSTGESALMNETFTSVSTGVVPSGVRLVSKGEVTEKHKIWGNTSANSKIGMTLQTSDGEKDISSSLGSVSGITGVKLYIAAAYDRSDTVKITVTFTTDLGDQVILVISVAPITGKSVSFVVDNVANIQLEPGIKNSAKSDNVQITNTSAYPVDVSLGEVRTPDGVSNPFTIINQGDNFTSDDLTTSGVKLGVLSDGIKFYWDTTPSASQGVFAKLSGNGVTDGSDRKTFNYFMEFNPMYSGSLQNFKYQITYKVTASSHGVNE